MGCIDILAREKAGFSEYSMGSARFSDSMKKSSYYLELGSFRIVRNVFGLNPKYFAT